MAAHLAIVGLLALSASLAFAAGEIDSAGRTPRPVIEAAAQGSQCVAPPAVMRRTHMDLLKHQRDDTVRGGVRGAKGSLKDCIDCHASQKTGSVAQSDSNFCVSCHSYVAVKIDCFECHTAKPRAVAQQGAK